MSIRELNRRAIVASIAAAPAAGLPAVAGIASPDPIFSAIERHKLARARFESVCRLTDKVVAEREGREVTAADRAEYERCDADELTAIHALSATAPTTIEGLSAALLYLVDFADEDRALEIFVRTAAASPVLAVGRSA